jgi:hypothetical protein
LPRRGMLPRSVRICEAPVMSKLSLKFPVSALKIFCAFIFSIFSTSGF